MAIQILSKELPCGDMDSDNYSFPLNAESCHFMTAAAVVIFVQSLPTIHLTVTVWVSKLGLQTKYSFE